MKKPYMWVIEFKIGEQREWEHFAIGYATRTRARECLEKEKSYTHDLIKYRIKKYVRES